MDRRSYYDRVLDELPAEREEKLPRWAQDKFRALRQAGTEYRRAALVLAGEGPQDSPVLVDPHGNPFPLDPKAAVQFQLVDSDQKITAQRRQDGKRTWLDLNAMTGGRGRLLVRPWAANTLHLTIED